MRNEETRRADTRPGLVLFTGHSNHVVDLAFSPDGTVLASLGYDQSIILWDTRTGKMVRKITLSTDAVYSVAFAPDGARLASSDWDGITLWDPWTGIGKRAIDDVQGSIAFLPDGSILADGAGGTSEIVRYDLRGNTEAVARYEGEWIYSFVVSTDGKRLAVGDLEHICVFDVPSSKCVLNVSIGSEDHPSLGGMALTHDGQVLAAGSGNRILLWDTGTGAMRTIPEACETLAFSPDGKALACGVDGGISIYDTRSLCRTTFLAGHKGDPHALAFSPDGNMLASGGWDRGVLLWDMETGGLLHRLVAQEHRVSSVAFADNGLRLESDHNDGTRRTWDLRTASLAETRVAAPKELPDYLAASPSGDLLAVPYPHGFWSGAETYSESIALVDAETGELRHILTDIDRDCCGKDATISAVFSPDGHLLAAGLAGFHANLWDVLTGQLLHSVRSRWDAVGTLAFAPDSRTLAVGTGYEPDIRLFSVKTGRVKRDLLSHTASVDGLAFSPNARTLASASADGSIKLWNPRDGRLLATLLILPSADDGVAEDWIIYTPEGYYNGSPGAEQFIRWQVGSDILPAGAYSSEFHRVGMGLQR